MKFVPDSSSTAQFYNNLVKGKQSRSWLGMSNRYQLSSEVQEYLISRYFDKVVAPFVSAESEILDFGCGPGIFTKRLCKISANVTGVDISREFIRIAKESLGKNASVFVVDENLNQLQDKLFDVILMVDVIHHLEKPREIIEKVSNRLKSGGLFLIFEPNLLSLPIFLLHVVDSNERGLLSLGTKKKYLRIFQGIASLEVFSYNGIVIGPANKFFCKISDLINSKFGKRLLDTSNPKIFMVFKKVDF